MECYNITIASYSLLDYSKQMMIIHQLGTMTMSI